jgi:hypothetical protein
MKCIIIIIIIVVIILFYFQEVTSHMLPKIMAHEDLPKPHRKVSRLRTIGHQIRYYHYFTMLVPPLPPPLLPLRVGLQERKKLMEKMDVDAGRGRGVGEGGERTDAVGRKGLVMKCVEQGVGGRREKEYQK